MSRDRAAGRDLTSLTERFGALLVVRVGIAATVVLVATLAHREVGVSVAMVAPITVTYLLVAVVTEWVRRAARLRAINAHHVMLLIDSVYIALVMAPTGGPRSELVFLFYVHLIAVSLLGSYRAGLRIALWDSFLLILVYTFSLSTGISRLLGAPEQAPPPTQEIVLSIVAFWLMALATAYFSSVNERELRRSKDELRTLAEMGAELEQARQPDEVVEVLLARAIEAFGFERAAVLLNSGNGIRVLATGGLSPRDLPEGSQPDSLVRRAWASQRPVLTRALDGAATADPILAGLLPGARNVVVVPMTAEGEPLGALAVERGGPLGVKLPLRTVAMLGQFAAHAALAVRTVRLLAEIERLATLDGLTGILNRRVFESALGREVSRTERSGSPLSLVMFDVDFFKRVNDTLGHQAGDDVLRHVARALRAGAREVDVVARYGGEEFVTLLPSCSLGDAVTVAERMRATIAADAGIARVTVSAGAASVPDNARTAAELIAAADAALYDAKRTGRDRISCSTRTPAAGSPLTTG